MTPAMLALLLCSLPPADEPQQDKQNKSVLEVKPGTEVLKEKDRYNESGYLHPFRRMPRFVVADQKKIWTSPFHTAKTDIKWWAIAGGVTVGLVVADRHIHRSMSPNTTLARIGNDASYLGAAYTLIPISAGFYLAGTAKGNDRFRETGLLAFETLVDVAIVQVAIKSIADRERPLEGTGKGRFFKSADPRYTSSFPSGHSMQTFALASVFAHQYPHKRWLQAAIYGYGAAVAGARVAANRHFPSDVVAGGAIGWFIGDYVYGRRHNPVLNQKHGVIQKILSHVSVGAGY
jgi:membrane-associated phospholipid phosphatase